MVVMSFQQRAVLFSAMLSQAIEVGIGGKRKHGIASRWRSGRFPPSTMVVMWLYCGCGSSNSIEKRR